MLFTTNILCMDIKLSLGKKINENSNLYPASITINEPIINDDVPIDLVCLFDISPAMDLFNLKKTLNFIIDTLNYNDRLYLASFDGKTATPILDMKEKEMLEMTEENKVKLKSEVILLDLKEKIDIQFKQLNTILRNFFKGFSKDEKNEKRVQSIIFISAGKNNEKQKEAYLYILSGISKNITLNIFAFNIQSNGKDLLEMAERMDGSFYYINNYETAEKSVLNIIGGLRKIKYKNCNINIRSNYKIQTLYGVDHMSSGQIDNNNKSNNNKKDNNNSININIRQFISGKDYTYVFLVDLQNNIKYGERVLYATVSYDDFINNKSDEANNFLNYYFSTNFFNLNKDEYCRVLAMEIINNFARDFNRIEKDKKNNLKDKLNEEYINIIKDCNNSLDNHISEIINKILDNMDISSINNWIYGVISEGYLKKGGTNLWYSNSYQIDLINKYIYNKKN